MKAIIQTGYVSPDNFELREIDIPGIKDEEVLVKVHSTTLNAGDVYAMRGDPFMIRFMVGLPRPKNYIPGYDVAGTVEKVGKKVTQFQPGDEVYGAAKNTLAEYVRVKAGNLMAKPEDLTFDQAATLPTAAITALLGIRDAGKVMKEHKVLINGASGGVGTFAVQIANALGAEVTGVCSSRNLELIRSIGADHVIDYTKNDFTKGNVKYDLILDQVANHSLSDCRDVLTPKGIHIPNSGNGGMGFILKAMILSLFIRQQGRAYYSVPKKKDFTFLEEIIGLGKLKPVIDKTYPLADASKAFRYMDEVHASGKVVIKVED